MAQSHAHHEAHHVNYFTVFWWLLALTILEIVAGVPSSGPSYPHILKGAILVILATTKAAMVALFFMHLRYEKTALGVVALIPLTLCVFVVLMTMPDF